MRFLTRWFTSSELLALSMALWNTTLKAYREKNILLWSDLRSCKHDTHQREYHIAIVRNIHHFIILHVTVTQFICRLHLHHIM